jgi:hypothetical protein
MLIYGTDRPYIDYSDRDFDLIIDRHRHGNRVPESQPNWK